MTFLLLIAFLAVVGSTIAAPLFEFVFATLLLIPVGRYLIAWLLLQVGIVVPNGFASVAIYGASFGLLLALASKVFGRRTEPLKRTELAPFAFFTAIYLSAYFLCMQWPDFIDLGERLRDYSMLASSIDSPVLPKEPWMDGIKLNYYVYWYRFGNLLSSVLGMYPWEAYHALVSFSISLYAAVIFQLVRVVIKGSSWAAAMAGVFIPFGANVAGALALKRADKGFGFEPDIGWWGPSRVIQGAIDEFPAWSFVLGDAHPHFLNIAALPLFALLLFRIITSSGSAKFRAGQAVMFVVGAALFLKASNAWEVPMWLGTVACICTLGAFAMLTSHFRVSIPVISQLSVFEKIKLVVGTVAFVAAAFVVWRYHEPESLSKSLIVFFGGLIFFCISFPWHMLRADLITYVRELRFSPLWAAFWLILFATLWLSGRHIVPPENIPLRLVRQPTQVTTTAELFMHWGVQMSLLMLGSICLLRAKMISVLLTGFLALSLLYDKAALFLYCIIGVQILRILEEKDEGRPTDWARVFEDALILSGLILVLVPEIAFLDDSYAPEIDRMNTIFKLYTTAWGLLGLGATSVIVRALKRFEPITAQYGKVVPATCWVLVGLGLANGALGFYGHTVPMRKNGSLDPSFEAKLEGLGEANKWHPGAADTIRALRKLPRGRVLEAQGRAYSYTCFVSTLASQPAYLGWTNHINLLNKVYAEVGRREQMTKEIYNENDCNLRKQKARKEEIRYLVLGTLERKAYPGSEAKDYSCFDPVVKSGDYALYQIPPQ